MNITIGHLRGNRYMLHMDDRSLELPLNELLNYHAVQIQMLEKNNFIPPSSLRAGWPSWVRAQLERKIS